MTRKIEYLRDPLSLKQLKFDAHNPRYAPYHNLEKANDFSIIRHLALTADLKELIQSIATNGYISIEPLIVLKPENENEGYIVLEGNRRLAALKLLSDPELAAKAGFTNLPETTSSIKSTFEKVFVTQVLDRNDARALIGFKHINGPQRWDSFSKAKFAKDWYVSEKPFGLKLKNIADSLGDGHSTIKRLVFGIFVLEQAEKEKLFDVEDRFYDKRIFAFSHLYTSLSKNGFQQYLGIESAWKDDEPKENPIPKDHLGNLKQSLIWLYGSRSETIEPVIKSQNPDLKNLNSVLTKQKAIKTLIARNDLLEAYEDVEASIDVFEKALILAHKSAETALTKISSYEANDGDLLEISTTLVKNSTIINNHMKSFNQNNN